MGRGGGGRGVGADGGRAVREDDMVLDIILDEHLP